MWFSSPERFTARTAWNGCATEEPGLVARGVVAGFVINAERRKAFGSAEADFNFAPGGIMRFFSWMLPQYIWFPQPHAIFSGDVREILKPFHRKNAPTGHVRDVGEQRRPVELFGGTSAISKRIKNTDGIELSVGFSNQTLDIAFVVPTMIIASVG